jgi:DNA-binding SARP family transcriptional activator
MTDTSVAPRGADERSFAMSTLRICLFGKFYAQCGNEILTDLYPRRLQELLSYLLIYRDQSHPRETLANVLWGDSSTSQSKRYLRQALWQIKSITESRDDSACCHLLLVDPDYVRASPEADLWLDVAALEQVCTRAYGLAGQALDDQQAQDLSDAAELYQGDLLEGWFQDWCLFERERLQNMYLGMLDKLVDHCEGCQQYEIGAAYASRILRYDRAREHTHRSLMRLHHLGGNRTAALRQFDCCVDALRRELAVDPSARTVELYDRIRQEQLVTLVSPIDTSGLSPDPRALRQTRVLENLRMVQVALAEVQDKVRRTIRTAEDVDLGSEWVGSPSGPGVSPSGETPVDAAADD